MRLAHGDIWARIDIEIAQNPHHDIALRMIARLGLADAAGIDQMLHIAVVGRHADQTAIMQQIRAGIADMRHNPISRNQRDGSDGGAHARETAFTLRLADDRVMRGHHRSFQHAGNNLDIALHIVLLDVSQRTDGDGGGGVASRMASHAVADGDQMLACERGILVVGTYGTHVGNDGGIHEQRL